MLVKARHVIRFAIREVQASRVINPSDSELQDGLRYLNRMMATLTAQGIDVGYTTLENLDDPLTSNMCATLGIVKNLALRLWPQYRSEPQANPLIISGAARGLETLRNIALQGFNVALYPDTMYVGSGNRERPYDQRYYDNENSRGEYIALENTRRTIRGNQ